jgi:hypothetical protein
MDGRPHIAPPGDLPRADTSSGGELFDTAGAVDTGLAVQPLLIGPPGRGVTAGVAAHRALGWPPTGLPLDTARHFPRPAPRRLRALLRLRRHLPPPPGQLTELARDNVTERRRETPDRATRTAGRAALRTPADRDLTSRPGRPRPTGLTAADANLLHCPAPSPPPAGRSPALTHLTRYLPLDGDSSLRIAGSTSAGNR